MKKRQPSLWTLGLGTLDLSREHVRDAKRTLPRDLPLPIRFVAGSAILALGAAVVVMDLAIQYPLRTWWFGELARRGERIERRTQEVTPPKQALRKEGDHDLAG